jgi:hypothetical protein
MSLLTPFVERAKGDGGVGNEEPVAAATAVVGSGGAVKELVVSRWWRLLLLLVWEPKDWLRRCEVAVLD